MPYPSSIALDLKIEYKYIYIVYNEWSISLELESSKSKFKLTSFVDVIKLLKIAKEYRAFIVNSTGHFTNIFRFALNFVNR